MMTNEQMLEDFETTRKLLAVIKEQEERLQKQEEQMQEHNGWLASLNLEHSLCYDKTLEELAKLRGCVRELMKHTNHPRAQLLAEAEEKADEV